MSAVLAKFLAGFLSLVIPPILNWIYAKFHEIVRDYEEKRAIDKAAADSVQKLKDAKTAEEIDKATDEALDHV